MLDNDLKAQLQAYLEKLVQPIELVASLDEGEKSVEMRSLLEDIAGLSEKISLRVANDDPRVPSFAINRTGSDIGVRFAGIPMGHEFTSLVLALLQVVATRRSSPRTSSSRSGRWMATTGLKPIFPCPARTVRTSCRHST